MTDEELMDLPEDPELAFAEYEKRVRVKMISEINQAEQEERNVSDEKLISYISSIIAAAKVLGLDILQNWSVPTRRGDVFGEYTSFTSDVDHYTMQIRFRNARRSRKYTVELTLETRNKIRDYITRIKHELEQIELNNRKREALFNKLNAFLAELDRNRVRFEIIQDVILESADTVQEVDEKLNPLRKILARITKMIGYEKQQEEKDCRVLPPPKEKKQLEPPRHNQEQEANINDLDEDIPF
ncbi:MAG: hypothetical protein KDG89_06470 [Geminicoccaceae bacterium]|nr:hypothetical protein [Geminicoccaceae bacterium]